MKEYLKSLKEYWSFILIAIYSIGYTYKYCYYIIFDINIFKYTSGADLLYTSLQYVILVAILCSFLQILSTIIIYTIVAICGVFSIKNAIRIRDDTKDKKKYSNYKIWSMISMLNRQHFSLYYFLMSFIFGIVLTILLIVFQINYTIIISFQIAQLIYFSWHSNKFIEEEGSTKINSIVKFLISPILAYIFLIILVGLLGFSNAVNKQFTSNKTTTIQFDYVNKEYKTDKTLNFIGETDNYIFLYDYMGESALIFQKSKIENYKITSKTTFFNKLFSDQ